MSENIIEEESSEEKEIDDLRNEGDESEKESRIRSVLTFIVGFLGGIIVCGMVGIVAFFVFNKLSENRMMLYANGSDVLDAQTMQKVTYLEALLKATYYEDVDDEKLKEGLYNGIVSGLGDPYSCYYSAKEIEGLYEEWSGNYQGIGAVLSTDTETGYVKVESFLKGGSAGESELQQGDLIVAVDGESIFEMALKDIVSRVKGEEGTFVTLTVENENGRKDITLERREINVPSVEINDEGDGIYNITITEFADNTYAQFVEAMEEAENNNVKALIIDLRGNPGGDLQSVVDICGEILPEGDVVYMEDKNGEQTHYKSSGENPIDIPLAVLVDSTSASASEIMAGAIKDYGVGTLVGTKTYGKGVVQEVIPLTDGSAVRVTVFKYFTPNGGDINHEGIMPDEVVPFDVQKYLEDGTDNQLEYAKEYLREQIGAFDENSESFDDDAA